MEEPKKLDSKFRFVILASKRAKELLQGAKPKLKTKSKNPILIAQEEVRKGLVDFEIIDTKKIEVRRPDDEGFIGEEIGIGEEGAGEEIKDVLVKSEEKPKKASVRKGKKKAVAKKKSKEKSKKP